MPKATLATIANTVAVSNGSTTVTVAHNNIAEQTGADAAAHTIRATNSEITLVGGITGAGYVAGALILIAGATNGTNNNYFLV